MRSRKGRDHHRRKQAHEAGADHQFDLVRVQHGHQRAVELLARPAAAMVDEFGGNRVAARTLETSRRGPIRDHHANFGLELAAIDGVDDRLQIGTLAG